MFTDNPALVKKKCLWFACCLETVEKSPGVLQDFTTVRMLVYDPNRYLEVYGKTCRVSYNDAERGFDMTAAEERYVDIIYGGPDWIALDFIFPDGHGFPVYCDSDRTINGVIDLIYESDHIYKFKLNIG